MQYIPKVERIKTIINELDQPWGVDAERYDALSNLGDTLPDYGTPIFDQVEGYQKDGQFFFYLGEDDAADLRTLYGVT